MFVESPKPPDICCMAPPSPSGSITYLNWSILPISFNFSYCLSFINKESLWAVKLMPPWLELSTDWFKISVCLDDTALCKGKFLFLLKELFFEVSSREFWLIRTTGKSCLVLLSSSSLRPTRDRSAFLVAGSLLVTYDLPLAFIMLEWFVIYWAG